MKMNRTELILRTLLYLVDNTKDRDPDIGRRVILQCQLKDAIKEEEQERTNEAP